ncbi:DNA-binding protein [Variovorax sp. NFACC27]|jgi:hypothetical protein|uniref:DNA-binding protein n=1 Tax=Variovorax paradoxus TaxID=34073 RepID=A0A5Q0LY02_VARPD|nr:MULTISPECIES: DNA-binding protein [Variovorax]SEF19388.1 hypothetical protein SAMN03159371_00106 [Variovorax sp. NFACC28]SEF72961.1 hypothetical protein SAMN03159365_00711 [Variovorax sp. NFACC29]SFB77491.1 hypothetical protein SAMN03159379_00710 [Variovorax sp. NFACC26]SFG77059.1 hypothetical protein SAMN03159447_04833 [Variovorax sp. NFACC27]MDN6885467.1 DNA-binding protein [Variovorax sp. CAN15]
MALDIRALPHPADRFRLTTTEFATQQLVNAQTVRKRLSLHGSYFGVKPLRLLNRRLLWPADSIKTLIEESQQ